MAFAYDLESLTKKGSPMRLRQWIWLTLLTLFSLPAFAAYKIVPAFVGGIDYKQAYNCARMMRRLNCKLNVQFTDYQLCIRVGIAREPSCPQSLTFFQLTNGGI